MLLVDIAKKIVAFIKLHPMKARLGLVIMLFSVLIYSIHPSEIVIAFREARPIYLMYAIVLMIPVLGRGTAVSAFTITFV